MKTISALKAWSREDLEQAVKAMAAIAGCAFALAWLAYFLRFGPAYRWLFGIENPTQYAAAQAAWGQLGDFIGGSLNPLLSALTLIGLVFTILLQHEAMTRTQGDNNLNIASLREQAELSLLSARLQSLSAALEVITEMHRQALQASDTSVIELRQKKERIATEILEINEAFRKRAEGIDTSSATP